MGFIRQEYWSELPCPASGDLPNPGTEPKSHVSCIDGEFFTTDPTRELENTKEKQMERLERKSIVTTILKKNYEWKGEGKGSSLRQSGREKAFANKNCGRGRVGC